MGDGLLRYARNDRKEGDWITAQAGIAKWDNGFFVATLLRMTGRKRWILALGLNSG